MKRPTLRVLEYRHKKTHPYYLDLRPFNNGRKFFKFKAEAEAERLPQLATLNRHRKKAVALAPAEHSAIIQARKKLAKDGGHRRGLLGNTLVVIANGISALDYKEPLPVAHA